MNENSSEEIDTDSRDNKQLLQLLKKVLQEDQPPCIAWTDIVTLFTWAAYESQQGARANKSLYLSFTARLPLLVANDCRGRRPVH